MNDEIKKLPAAELALLLWHNQRRKEQTPPDPLPLIWFLKGGRGSGKTLTASNHIFEIAKNLPFTPENRIVRVALIGETFKDVKNTMIEGATGLRSIVPRSLEVAWNRTTGEYKFKFPPSPGNPYYREVHCQAFSTEVPDMLRGPQHHLAWFDEPAKARDADAQPTKEGTTWSNLIFGLRLGTNPHVIVSGTPTPCRLVKYLVNHPECQVTAMTTFDNRENLPEAILRDYERLDPKSRAARQELYAELILDNPDGLFSQENFNDNRYYTLPADATYKVMGWDPSASSSPDADETGIVIVAATQNRHQTRQAAKTLGTPEGGGTCHAYVTDDLSGHFTPAQSTTLVIRTILEKRIDDLLFEQNQGVDFIIQQLRQALQDNTTFYAMRPTKKRTTAWGPQKAWLVSATFTQIIDDEEREFLHKFHIIAIHANKGKQVRAEAATIRYDSGQVHHPPSLPTCPMRNCKAQLEEQAIAWSPAQKNSSPDRLDALVYALLHIFGAHALNRNQPAKLSRPPAVDLRTGAQDTYNSMIQNDLGRKYAKIYSTDMLSGREEAAAYYDRF